MFNGRTQTTSQNEIRNSGFWANINVGEFQEQRGIPLQIPEKLVESSLLYAMQSLEIDLQEVEAKYKKQGYARVYEIPTVEFNGKSLLVLSYEKAVYARAKAELLPEFATLSARELHEKRDTVAEARLLEKEATMAIRQLKGKKRGSVELI
ncbi:head completion/stabilization protein [Mannheimia haemolytica]